MDLPSKSRDTLNALASANDEEQADLFAWRSTQLCNFLATHNILAALSTFRGRTQYQNADMLSPPLEKHDGYSRDPYAQIAGQLEYLDKLHFVKRLCSLAVRQNEHVPLRRDRMRICDHDLPIQCLDCMVIESEWLFEITVSGAFDVPAGDSSFIQHCIQF